MQCYLLVYQILVAALIIRVYHKLLQILQQVAVSDWNIKEIGSSSVRFAPPDANPNAFLSPNVAILVQPAEQYLDTNDMKVKSKPPLTYVLGTLMFLGGHIVRSTSANIPGAESALKVEYTSSAPIFHGEHYTIEIVAIKDGKRYTLELAAPSLQIPDVLPTFQKMINSFQVTK